MLRVSSAHFRGFRRLGQEAGESAQMTVEQIAEAKAESTAWKAVKKGILISAILTGIQIIYDLRCAKACSAKKRK